MWRVWVSFLFTVFSICLADCEECGASFLQHGQHLESHTASIGLKRGLSGNPHEWWVPAACVLAPFMCSEPFDCLNNTGKLKSRKENEAQMAGPNGVNVQSWCYSDPSYFNTAVLQCLVKKDLLAYAQTMFEYAVARHLDEIDATYCAYMGFCHNDQVALNTTLDEAQVMCDVLLPEPNGWRSAGTPPFTPGQEFTAADAKNYAMAACAMGNFQCDVIYCRETYCKKEQYQHIFEEVASK